MKQYSLGRLYALDHKTKTKAIGTNAYLEITQYVKKLDAMKKRLTNTSNIVQALVHQDF